MNKENEENIERDVEEKSLEREREREVDEVFHQ
jgi:hypothetical protein